MENYQDLCTLVTPKVESTRYEGYRLQPQQHSGFRRIHFPPGNLPLRNTHPITLHRQASSVSPAYDYPEDDTVRRLEALQQTAGEDQQWRVGFPLCRFREQKLAEQFLCLFCHLVCTPDFLTCSLCNAKYCRSCILESSKLRFSQLCPHCNSSCPLTASVSQALMQAVQELAAVYSELKLECQYRAQGCTAVLSIREVTGHECQCPFQPNSHSSTDPSSFTIPGSNPSSTELPPLCLPSFSSRSESQLDSESRLMKRL